MHATVSQVMELYPKIFFACHRRHVPDPVARRVLSAHQASILDHLDRRAATSLTELARHMGIKASAMSIAIGRLVRQGYVARKKDKVDKRRILLRLTADGARIKGAQSVLEPDRVEAMLDLLSETEQSDAVRGLALLAGAAQRMMHRQSDTPGPSPLEATLRIKRKKRAYT